ncbi:MAG TPA: hypothetical protein VLA29_00275 [Acidimicrobiia bacterium]|nr:hypothetical protein [Acidimicrobiia bacterium]
MDAANEALLESLDIYQLMGLIVDMGAVMLSIARLRSVTGASEKAVEIAACVLADPVTKEQPVIRQAVLSEPAMALLDELAGALDPELYTEAHARGTTKALEIGVKELLATRQDIGG